MRVAIVLCFAQQLTNVQVVVDSQNKPRCIVLQYTAIHTVCVQNLSAALSLACSAANRELTCFYCVGWRLRWTSSCSN